VQPEKRVLHAQTSRAIMNNALLLVTRMQSKPVKLLGYLRATLIGRATGRRRVGWPDIRASLTCLAQAAFEGLLNELVLDLGGKSRQGLAGHTLGECQRMMRRACRELPAANISSATRLASSEETSIAC